MHRFLIALLALIVATDGNACSCVGKGTVQQEFKNSDLIFAGVVVSIADPADRTRVPRHLDPESDRKVTFRVMQWWKTDAFTESVELRTGFGGGDCGYPVEVGKSYLVYARRDLRNQLVFGICGRTAALICVTTDVEELGDAIKTYETFDAQSLIEREQPYTTYWRPCIKPPVLTGDRGLEMDRHCRFTVNGVIGVDGVVHDFKINGRSLPRVCPESLDRQIRERVAEWRFLPAEFAGKPIETLLTAVSLREPITETEYAKRN